MSDKDENQGDAQIGDPRMLRDTIDALRASLEEERAGRQRDAQASQAAVAGEIEQLKTTIQSLRDAMEAERASSDARIQETRRIATAAAPNRRSGSRQTVPRSDSIRR